MKMKKIYLFIVALFMTIGFAAVTTSLMINGTISLGFLSDDFEDNIIFSAVSSNDGTVEIKENKKVFNFTSNELEDAGDSVVVDFIVTNYSKNYGADVTVTCALDEESQKYKKYLTIEDEVYKFDLASGKSKYQTLILSIKDDSSTTDFSVDVICVIDASPLPKTMEEENEYHFSVASLGNGTIDGNASEKTFAIRKDEIKQFEIDPDTDYYLSGAGCSDDYLIFAHTGNEATSSQTVTVLNPGVDSNSECEVRFIQPSDTTIHSINKGYNSEFWQYRDEIEQIEFSITLEPMSGSNIKEWDISETGNDMVMAYYNLDTKTLSIQGDGSIYINEDSSYLFRDFKKLKKIVGLDLVDTSQTTKMVDMFYGCENLESIDLSNFNTSNVTDMDSMFYGCLSLKSLNVSKFDTSNVTNMYRMFDSNSSLTTLDLSSFNTSKVITMKNMFDSCENLQTLKLGDNFNTSKVTNMYKMFYGLKNLKELNLGEKFYTTNVKNMHAMFGYVQNINELRLDEKFNTTNVTDMSQMFEHSGFAKIDLGNAFNTSKVTDMYKMFYDSANLTNLELGDHFDTSNVTDTSQMFDDCLKLIKLDLGKYFNTSKVTTMFKMFNNCNDLEILILGANFNTLSVTDMSYMFDDCWNLKSLDLSTFNTSKVTDMHYMFSHCENLNELILGDYFYTSNVTDMSNMFYNVQSLEELDLGKHFDTSKVESMERMFEECQNLEILILGSNFNTENVTTMKNMFVNCKKLKKVDLSTFITSKVTNMYKMFYGCESLTELNVSSFDTSNVEDMQEMFKYCSNVKILDLSSFNTSNVTNMQEMFKGDGSLTTIYVSNKWNTNGVTSGDDMFYNCTKLKGQAETSYDENNIGLERARVDTETTPGYLTLKV